jgi:hypothetical protein
LAISPIQNKIGKALIEPRLRNMLAQPKSTLADFQDVGAGKQVPVSAVLTLRHSEPCAS